jgi:3-oxoacyl-[acyl-carrier-protein] synthase-1
VPVNSYKGFGHTLGAAGVIESVMCVYSLREKVLLHTKGFHDPGVAHPITVIDRVIYREISCCLKIASGFGGCNVALLFHTQ